MPVVKRPTKEKKKKNKKLKEKDIQLILANHIGIRKNIIVPNVSWGFDGEYEKDLLSISKAGYVTEYEIKVSVTDLKKDKQKKHNHDSKYNNYLFFVLPDYIWKDELLEHIPEKAGVLIIIRGKWVEQVKSCKKIHKNKMDINDQLKVARLGCLRYWSHEIKQKRKH